MSPPGGLTWEVRLRRSPRSGAAPVLHHSPAVNSHPSRPFWTSYAKPALGPWYAQRERRYFEPPCWRSSRAPAPRPEYVLLGSGEAVTGCQGRRSRTPERRPPSHGHSSGSSGISDPVGRRGAHAAVARGRRSGRWRAGKTGARVWPSNPGDEAHGLLRALVAMRGPWTSTWVAGSRQ